MTIIHIGTAVYREAPVPETSEASKAKHDEILAGLNAPVYLGSVKNVAYDHKVDRYALAFIPSDGKALTLKATDEVAAFVAEHVSKSGYWVGRMESGSLVDANLIQSD